MVTCAIKARNLDFNVVMKGKKNSERNRSYSHLKANNHNADNNSFNVAGFLIEQNIAIINSDCWICDKDLVPP